MTSVVLLVAVMMLVACAADDPQPTCQQALDHFYSASCTFVDADKVPVPKATALSQCQTTVASAPKGCRDEVSGWLRCVNAVPSPATKDDDCQCSPEVTALQTCS